MSKKYMYSILKRTDVNNGLVELKKLGTKKITIDDVYELLIKIIKLNNLKTK